MLAKREWYAVYTRSRHEKAVCRSLQRKVIEVFLPLHEVLSHWKDRRKWVQKPLFPGYLFVQMLAPEFWTVTNTRGVVHIVGDGQDPIPVPEEQVEAVRRLVEADVKLDPWRHMRKGTLVRMKTGPLIGLEGFIVERRGTCRLVVCIGLLGRSVATEIDAGCVEPVRSLAA